MTRMTPVYMQISTQRADVVRDYLDLHFIKWSFFAISSGVEPRSIVVKRATSRPSAYGRMSACVKLRTDGISISNLAKEEDHRPT